MTVQSSETNSNIKRRRVRSKGEESIGRRGFNAVHFKLLVVFVLPFN